jgi:hypothetical protein
MSWNFFTARGAIQKNGSIDTNGFNTIASASSIATTNNTVNYITGTTNINTMTGGTTGSIVTLQSYGQATGICIILVHGTGSNALSLRDSQNLGIYAGESVTFQYNGSYWIEINRNLREILDSSSYSANISVSATTQASPNRFPTGGANGSLELSSIKFDGYTAVEIHGWAYMIQNVTDGTNAAPTLYISLWDSVDGGANTFVNNIGFGSVAQSTTVSSQCIWHTAYRFIPSAASHKYSFALWRSTTAGTSAATFVATSLAPSRMMMKRSI